MNQKEIESYRKAGKIASETMEYAKKIIKPGMLLSEIAEKLEKKIIELGGKPAFPVNLSVNEVAAHHTPLPDSKETAQGLLKIDLGVHIKGYIADTAITLDLEGSEENKKLIQASEKALKEALKTAKSKTEVGKIGRIICKTITLMNLSPIRNLSGHELGEYKVHAGLTIPNYDNGNEKKLEEGAYAIEPFATSGEGGVYEGKPSGIYKFEKRTGVRDQLARKILDYIEEEYNLLPFCSRWIVKKFGKRAIISMKFLEQAGAVYQYPELIEKSRKKVSQAEHTFIIIKDKTEITTKRL